jgi:fibronectin type 3 domain-containing protein
VIYRDILADFQPEPNDSIAATTDTVYTDDSPGVTKDTDIHYFYAVRAADAGGYKSDGSNVVGEFDRSLINSSK